MPSHHKLIYFFTISAILIFNVTQAVEIINFSQSTSFLQGTASESIFCQADQNIDSCVWKKIGNDDFKCVFSRQESCPAAEGLSGSVEGAICTLVFDREINYDDSGTYECIGMIAGEEKQAKENVDLDVWVKAQGQFEDVKFGGSEHEVQVPLQSEASTFVSCSATGAIPAAQISVSLVNATDNEVIRTLPEIEDAGSYDEEQNKLIKVFDLHPSMEDCGQIVVCNIDQGEKAHVEMRRQLEVVFPPQKAFQNLDTKFGYQSGSETTVTIIFEANPQPQLIWHHIAEGKDETIDGGRPDYDIGTDVPPIGSFNLSPGSEDGNYKALEISYEDHQVNATLVITNADASLKEGRFYLEAINSEGSKNYEFGFSEYAPVPQPTEPTPEPKGMGGGTIAVIVIIVLAAITAVGLTVWAKNNNRWCFTPPEPRRDEFDQVPTVEDPIIKESSKPSSNEEPSKPKEQEEPTDNPV